MRKAAALFVALIALLSACSPGERDYSRWENLPPEGWLYTDTVSLLAVDTALTDNDSIVSGDVLLALRHSNDYPYSNIWLELTYHGEGHTLVRDTINLRLADVYGRWLGSGFGAGYQQEVTASPGARIDLTRPVELRHIMRVDTLHGIEQVGVLIRR